MEHTADIKFQAFGKNFEEALINTSKATFAAVCRDTPIKPVKKRDISLSSRTKENLVYDLINEFLFIMDTESLILSKIETLKVEKEEVYKLSGSAFFDSTKNYDISGDIKSATYSEMVIEEKKDEVMIQVVLDI